MSDPLAATEPVLRAGGLRRQCLFAVTILLVEDSRSASEAIRLFAAESGARVVIIGAGFIGCEVAATLRGAGVENVAVVDVAPHPMPVLGEEIGPEYATLLDLLSEAREGIRAEGRSSEDADWQQAFRSGIVDLVRNGQIEAAKELLQRCLSSSSA